MTTPGTCALCGTAIEISPNTPRRRYCSPRCRKTAWRRRHPRPGHHRDSARDVAGVVPAVPPPAGPPPAARCPHCAAPVAVITLLVAPAAAHVPAPETGHV